MAPSTSAQGAAAGQIKGASGQYAEAVEIIRRAMRVEPDYAQWIPSALQWFLIALGRHDEAKEIANGVLLSRTTITNTQGAALRHLAVIAVFEDEVDVARSYIKRLRKLKPKWSVSGVLRSNYYFKNQDFIKRYANALRKAGLPEYPPGKGPKAKPKKPSIAVLPFANLSDDKEQEYFADGMTDDLITDLSKLSGLIVIARNSVFTYKGKAVKVQEIAKDLNVTHVLEGSVRRSGGKVRINAQLIDAQTGAHLWAEIFDREFTEIFALQDDVREKIVAALKVTLTADEKKKLARRPTANLKAYETYLRAREAHQRFDAPGLTKALKLYQEAIDLDPTFADAYAGDALAATVIYFKGLFWVLKEDDARQRAEQSITRALKFDPGNVNAFRARARIKSINGRHDDAIATARHAVAANPNKASAHRSLASALLFAGRKDQALREVEAAGRLDPKPDVIDGAASGLV
jgi:TolB-like protein/Flp pilus assembly protein TadD